MIISKKLEDKHYLNIQLIATCIILFVTYGFLFFSGKLNIYMDIGADTYCNYWPGYAFFSDYIRNPPYGGWSFQLGLGSNIFTYYSLLFDPFNIIVLLFPKGIIEYGIFLATVAKFLTVSIVSHFFLKQMGYRGIPLVAASLVYTFSGYMVGWGQHYQFATMFCLFTFVLYGFERWLNLGKWLTLSLAIALLIGCNTYFSYMIFLFLVLYYILRYFSINQFNVKKFVFHGIKTAWVLLIGVALASVLVLPQVYVTLQSPRVSGRIIPQLQIASLGEYFTIVCRFLSNNILGIHYFSGRTSVYTNFYEAPFLYVGVLSLFIIPRLFSKRNFKEIYLFSALLVLFSLAFPSFSNLVFNAFSTFTYRWTFILVPVMSIAVAKGLTISMNEEKTYRSLNVIVAHVIFFVCLPILIFRNKIFLTNEQFIIVLASIGVLILSALAYLLVLNLGYKFKKKTLFSALFLLVLIFDLGTNTFISANLRYSIKQSDKNNIPYFDNTNSAVGYLKGIDKGFYRVNKTYSQVDLADALFQGFNGEKQYNSIINKLIWDLIDTMDLREKYSNHFYGFDDKYDLRNLTSVKYMLSKDQVNFDGYKLLAKQGDVNIYENLNSLPLSFTYDSFMSFDTFSKLDMYQKQRAMYSSFVLPQNSSYIPDSSIPETKELKSIEGKSLNMKKPYYKDITETTNNFPRQLKYTANSADSQIYIGLETTNRSSMILKFTANSPVSTNGRLYLKLTGKEYNEIYSVPFVVIPGEKDYLVNIASLDVEEIRLDLSEAPGEYEIKNLTLSEPDKNQIISDINKLRNNELEIKEFSDYSIKGDIVVDGNKMLYFAIPYDKGWTAFVDNKPVQLHNINIAFMGLPLGEGNHHIEIKYKVPGLSIGLTITIITTISLFLYFVVRRFFTKKKVM